MQKGAYLQLSARNRRRRRWWCEAGSEGDAGDEGKAATPVVGDADGAEGAGGGGGGGAGDGDGDRGFSDLAVTARLLPCIGTKGAPLLFRSRC